MIELINEPSRNSDSDTNEDGEIIYHEIYHEEDAEVMTIIKCMRCQVELGFMTEPHGEVVCLRCFADESSSDDSSDEEICIIQ